MSNREEFVLKAREAGANLSELCREYGISRKTAYKWKSRYEASGLRGLEDMSRRPHSHPLGVSGEVVADVVATRHAHGRWGPRKIAAVLRDRHGVSSRTVARILVRAGLVLLARRRRRRPTVTVEPPRLQPTKPNALWTVDFKGWWLAKSGERCEPLTIRDAFSRKVLAAVMMVSTQTKDVMPVFKDVFRNYGIPDGILSDGGPPFVASHSALGLTTLSAWWISLGIEHYRSRPAKPSDNGGHERMHRDMADELEAVRALDRKAQQLACDRWRHDFNHHRPHEAIGMKRPDDLYVRSPVEFHDKPIEVLYPDNFLVRTVTANGRIKHERLTTFITSALARQRLGLEWLSPRRWTVWFAHRRLGELDLSSGAVFEPAGWNRPGGPPTSTVLALPPHEISTDPQPVTEV